MTEERAQRIREGASAETLRREAVEGRGLSLFVGAFERDVVHVQCRGLPILAVMGFE